MIQNKKKLNLRDASKYNSEKYKTFTFESIYHDAENFNLRECSIENFINSIPFKSVCANNYFYFRQKSNKYNFINL